MTNTAPKNVAIVIDIECRGDDMIRNGIVSIGVCVGSSTSVEVIEKRRFDLLPLDYIEKTGNAIRVYHQDFEDRCMDEFWSKRLDQLKTMQENAVDPLEAIRAFRAFIDKYDDGISYRAVICGDATGFDFAMINYYLARAQLSPLWRSATSQYRPTNDTDSYSRGVLNLDYSEPWVYDSDLISKFSLAADQENHDHMPENDAEYIYRFHTELITKLQK